MEADVAKYQDILRKKIYSNELNVYEKIGEEKLDDFYEKYDREFKRVSNRISFLNKKFIEIKLNCIAE
jgi:hypothetical protein